MFASGKTLKGLVALAVEAGERLDAIARGLLFAIGQPPEVDVGSIVIRPTAQDEKRSAAKVQCVAAITP